MTYRDTRKYKGAASIFVVIFTTLLLSIITLSFMRIMLSEAGQTVNYNLSQSAYDSALAGIEDAKVALLKYQDCLSRGNLAGADPNCRKAIDAMRAEGASDNCDIVSDILSRHNTGSETIIQSEEGTTMGQSGRVMDQAYTCVKISEHTSDYVSTLNQNNRSKIIPLRTANNNDIDYLELQWFNDVDNNKMTPGIFRDMSSGNITSNKLPYSFLAGNHANNFALTSQAPPVLRFRFMQSDDKFTLASFNQNAGDKANRGGLLFRPSKNGVSSIANSPNVGLASSSDKSLNNPVDVKCDNLVYSCSIRINLPRPIAQSSDAEIRSDATSFIFLSLPYGNPETTFSLTAHSKEGAQIPFKGVQSRIDSTGRASDLVRRVEARIEMVDIYYPFPEYEVNINSTEQDSFWKNFYVTRNCWTSDGPCSSDAGSL